MIETDEFARPIMRFVDSRHRKEAHKKFKVWLRNEQIRERASKIKQTLRSREASVG
jgi:hypothetical protein